MGGFGMSPPDLDRGIRMANELLDRGLHQQAVELLREVLSLDPDHPIAHASMAVALIKQRRLSAADHEIRRALTCDPDSYAVQDAAARVRLAQGRLDDAQSHLTWMLDSRPGDAASLTLLGRLRRRQNRPHDARTVFEEVLTHDDRSVVARVQLAEIALDADDVARATALATEAIRLGPDDPDARVLSGRLFLRRGAVDDAHRQAVVALRGDIRHEGALSLLVAVKVRQAPGWGWWWQLHAWLAGDAGSRRIMVLLSTYLGYRILWLLFGGLDKPVVQSFGELIWVACVSYSVVAPIRFRRALDAELGQVTLRS